MKIQCNACEAAEAAVLCCADEAALCWACDEKVHAANKLASKHQRVPLLSAPNPSRLPKCDICQEASGYFFCLEDRALFCRTCDVAVHTANSYVSAHRRFLLTGVQVGLEPTEPVSSFAKEQPNSAGRVAESPSVSLPKGNTSMSFTEANEGFYGQESTDGVFGPTKSAFSGVPMSENLPDWPLEDFFGFTDFSPNYNFAEHGSSKADSGKFGSSEGSPTCFPVDEEVDVDECLGQVPEIPSPPTASGLHWQRNLHYPASERAAFVPDICSSEDFYGYQPRTASAKRRRPC